jgi:hypothetical protein
LQSTKDATKFYEGKISELGANLKDLETIVQGKSNNLRVVEDGMSPRDQKEDHLTMLIFIHVQSCVRKFLPLAQHQQKLDIVLKEKEDLKDGKLRKAIR